MTREELLQEFEKTKLFIGKLFDAATEENAHFGLLPEDWTEFAERAGREYPKPRVYVPYVPDWEEIHRLQGKTPVFY